MSCGRATLADLHARYGVPKPVRSPWRCVPHQGRVRIVLDLPDYTGAKRPPAQVIIASMDLQQAKEVLDSLPAALRQAREANDP